MVCYFTHGQDTRDIFWIQHMSINHSRCVLIWMKLIYTGNRHTKLYTIILLDRGNTSQKKKSQSSP